MIKRICGSQSGFSIIQGMLLAGAVAGMAYVGTKLTTDQKMAQKGVESKSRVEQLHSMIYSIMQNKNHCTETFTKNSVNPAPSSTIPITQIWAKDNAAPVFSKNTNLGGGAYNAALVYMNNSVTINDMNVTFQAGLDQHATLKVLYGKLDSKDEAARTGKGYGGQAVARDIKLKIQRDPLTNNFESCYAVDEDVDGNQNMVKEFCEGLGTSATVNLFEWSDTYQRCLLKDLHCPPGKIFAGYDSNGLRRCFLIKDWMNVGNVIDTASLSTCNAATSTAVGFVIVGGKAKVQCSGGAGCTSSCDCAGANDVCESGSCVNRTTGCINGTYAKGDASCRWLCTGGFWSCGMSPPGPPACGSLPTLPNGTLCSESPAGSDGGLPQCSRCQNAPSLVCGCGFNPSTKGTCGQTSNCTSWSMCY